MMIRVGCPKSQRRAFLPAIYRSVLTVLPPLARTQLEMILQAQEYESAQGLTLQEFFDSTRGKWRTELGRTWAAEIVARRPGTSS